MAAKAEAAEEAVAASRQEVAAAESTAATYRNQVSQQWESAEATHQHLETMRAQLLGAQSRCLQESEEEIMASSLLSRALSNRTEHMARIRQMEAEAENHTEEIATLRAELEEAQNYHL
jgi:protein-arginine kinase activator protein McsA